MLVLEFMFVDLPFKEADRHLRQLTYFHEHFYENILSGGLSKTAVAKCRR
jgi:hypothetical protein